MSKPSIEYTILEIEENDIERGGLLEVLENPAPVGCLSKPAAKAILIEIKSNLLHRIFIAVVQVGYRPGFDTRSNYSRCRTKIHLWWRASRTHRGCGSEG